eukprot:UN03826
MFWKQVTKCFNFVSKCTVNSSNNLRLFSPSPKLRLLLWS